VAKKRALSDPNNVRLLRNGALLFSVIIVITVVLLAAPCWLAGTRSGVCQASPDWSLLIGAMVGVLTTMGFFILIEQTQQKIEGNLSYLAEIYAKAYVVRTCLLNLNDIFKGERKGGHLDVLPTEANRLTYLGKLNEKYLQSFPNPDQKVVEIYDLAYHHRPIDSSHSYKSCADCAPTDVPGQGLVGKIQKYLEDNPNPVQI
jgi:hypothetical protein